MGEELQRKTGGEALKEEEKRTLRSCPQWSWASAQSMQPRGYHKKTLRRIANN
ncbi:FecR family protein [Sesbania bispinosa]|nr:FecR family protein [Sesbania bispinosa]